MITYRKRAHLLRCYLRQLFLFLCLSREGTFAANLNDVADEFEECTLIESRVMEETTDFFMISFENLFSSSHGEFPETRFIFYGYRDSQSPEYVTNTNFSDWNIEVSNYDATYSNVFVVPGYKQAGNYWITKMKDAFIKRDNSNVFVVEWGQPTTSYEEHCFRIPDVGTEIAMFIANLAISKNIDVKDVYLIGVSIGAHLAGFAGKAVKRNLKSLVGRITGLDPAGPGYYFADPTQRLDATDAAFVDVIHTNAACTRYKGFGYPYSSGHFDFYPNGGNQQPGCRSMNDVWLTVDISNIGNTFNYFFGIVDAKVREAMDKNYACSHWMSWDIFIASIEYDFCEFLAVQCSSWRRYLSGLCDDHVAVAMGYSADVYKGLLENSSRKKFYLITSGVYPYCLQ